MTPYGSCQEAINMFLKRPDDSNVSANRADVRCTTTSKCQIKGNHETLHACLRKPLAETSVVFAYMHGKTSPIKIRGGGTKR